MLIIWNELIEEGVSKDDDEVKMEIVLNIITHKITSSSPLL